MTLSFCALIETVEKRELNFCNAMKQRHAIQSLLPLSVRDYFR